jgi:hypothetical protein
VTSSDGTLRLSAVSAPAPYVSGDSLTVEAHLTSSSSGSAPQVTFEVDGHAAKPVTDGSTSTTSVRGVVSGLVPGANTVTAHLGGTTATLHVDDHPIQGPMFSGPRQMPFACTTAGAGLGPASPPDCAAPTKVTLHYLSTDGTLKPLPDPTKPPADVATVTVDGRSVRGIVREEEGVIDRSIYDLAILEPGAGVTNSRQLSAATSSGWNRRLVYRYGGGCGTTYSQGADFASALDPKLLAKGYAVVTSTLNTFQSACNAVLSAEVTTMVKQHFIDTYGLPDFTIGDGGSGGSIQQLQIAQDYPGLLDGLSPELPFPDAVSISAGVSDCTLLDTYYSTHGSSLTHAQRAAINGHATDQTCALWQASFAQEIKANSCGATVPDDEVYDAAHNPKGVRCTLQDGNVNIVGIDPSTGFAYRPLSNVGVQYGLEALDHHQISVDQFLDLNQYVGGYDNDGNVIPSRTKAPSKAFEAAYGKGMVDEGGALWNVPIVLTNPYDDPIGDIHDRFRSFSIRARLTRPDGTKDPNLIIWTIPGPTSSAGLDAQLAGALSDTTAQIELLDQWLTAARTHPTDRGAPAALAAARPALAVDTCRLADGEVLRGATVYDGSNACTRAYPLHGDPRTAAGAPLRNDVLSCQLVPVSQAHYDVTFTSQQRSRLADVFPHGVCDWSKTSVGYRPLESTWLDFSS